MKRLLFAVCAALAFSSHANAVEPVERADPFAGLPTIRGTPPEAYVCAAGCGYLLSNLVSDEAYEDRWRPFLRWRVDGNFGRLRTNGSIEYDSGVLVARRILIDPEALNDLWIAHMPMQRIAAEFERSGLDVNSRAWAAWIETVQPDPVALRKEVVFKREITSEKECPALRELMQALVPLEDLRIDIPTIGRHDGYENAMFDGASHRIEFSHVYINRNMGSFAVEGNYLSAPALWIEKAEATLAPCWRPMPERDPFAPGDGSL